MTPPIHKWVPDRLPDLSSKTFAVTGANSGIGFEAARLLAIAGGHVILLCRDKARGEAALNQIRAAVTGPASLRLEALDLASLGAIRATAITLGAIPLDALILNAGIMAPPKRKTTADGFELHWGVNHLGHFLLAGLLAENVLAAGGRFVAVSSSTHKTGLKRIRFEDPNWTSGYQPMAAYAHSKLANALFARELNNRLSAQGKSPSAYICHPGYAATGIASSETGPFMRGLVSFSNHFAAQSATRGAWPTVLAAAEPNAQPGAYYGPTGPFELWGAVGACKLAPQAKDDAAAARLWTLSEEAVDHTWPI